MTPTNYQEQERHDGVSRDNRTQVTSPKRTKWRIPFEQARRAREIALRFPISTRVC